MIELRRIEDRVDPGCVVTADPDGTYLFVAKHKPGWVQVTVIGAVGELADYVAAAETAMGSKFEVSHVHQLEIVNDDPDVVRVQTARGFTGIIMAPVTVAQGQIR
jgi:6-phosphogluconolactonase (cycloisomerase 2 family)